MGKGTSFFRPHLVFSADRKQRAEEAARSEQFRLIMLPHLDAAYNFARYLTRDATAAEDVVQDAFLRAFRSFDSWRGDSPKAWLLVIVRNCFLTSLAGDRDRHVTDDESESALASAAEAVDEESPEVILAQRSEATMLRKTVESLPEPFREALVLRELEELSYKEIALLTNVAVGTVMSRISRARQMLAELLLPNGEPSRRAQS